MKNIIKITDLKDLRVETIKMIINKAVHIDKDLMISKKIEVQKAIIQNLDNIINLAMIVKY